MGSERFAEHLEATTGAAGPSSAPTRLRFSSVPHWRTSLIGRERIIADIVELLRQDSVSLLNLTGPGGVGKTRLAAAVATTVGEFFPDGIVFVPLDTLRDPSLVVPTIASAFGVTDSGGQPLAGRLVERLLPLRMLLILDNVEHLTEAVPDISNLLSSCPSLTILSTSRVVLHITGEHDIRVDPLPLPSAVELFITRARAANSAFAVTAETARTLTQICARLDGLPLALELAAARSVVLPPTALLARLDQALTLLTVGTRDQPDRLRTMRNAISWSYDLLTTEEQELFRSLTVFVSSFPLDAAMAIAPNQAEAFDAIGSLVDKSILQRVEARDDPEPRYRMLETVREFGLEQLDERGDGAAARLSHAAWYVQLVETAEPHLDGDQQVAWQDRLETDLPNIRMALAWSTEHDIDLALRLVSSLRQFWIVRGNLSEAWRALNRVLESDAGYPSLRAKTLLAAAWIRFAQSDGLACLDLANSALEIYRRTNNRHAMASALIAVGFSLDHMGFDALDQDMVSGAVLAFRESLALAETLGDRRCVALATYGLASVAQGQGDAQQATDLFADALTGFEGCNDWRSIGWTMVRTGVLAASMGDARRAASSFERALPIFLALRDWGSAVQIIVHVARLALAAGRPGDTVQLIAAAGAFHALEGLRPTANEQADRTSLIEQAGSVMDGEEYAAALARGRSLSIDDAITHAHALLADGDVWNVPPEKPGGLGTVGLTQREQEVLRMLSLGLTDRQIAAKLSLSPRTVGGHVTNLLGKLGVESRTAAAILAIRLGLD
jgi:non-specific serine/threonine protein kinase